MANKWLVMYEVSDMQTLDNKLCGQIYKFATPSNALLWAQEFNTGIRKILVPCGTKLSWIDKLTAPKPATVKDLTLFAQLRRKDHVIGFHNIQAF